MKELSKEELDEMIVKLLETVARTTDPNAIQDLAFAVLQMYALKKAAQQNEETP